MTGHPFRSRRSCLLLLCLSLVLYWVMAVTTSPRMGVTGDEVVHLTGGYSYWKFNDYRLHPENGNLAQRLAALPLLALNLNFPSLADPHWVGAKVNLVGEKFFFKEGNPVDLMLLFSRMMIALAGVFTLWITWRWSLKLFGTEAGWLALGLAVFCPALLAHGALATSDMVMTATVLAALSAVWRLFHRATWLRLFMAALACGLAFLSKMSGVIIVPVIAALVILRWRHPAPLAIAFTRPRWIRSSTARLGSVVLLTGAVAAGSLVVLWAGFGFRYSGFNTRISSSSGYYWSWESMLGEAPLPLNEQRLTDTLIPTRPDRQPGTIDNLIRWTRDHRLLPEAYLWGFAQTSTFSRYRPAYLMGEYRPDGWTGFFPLAFVLKTPPASLLLFALGLAALGYSRFPKSTVRKSRPWLYKASPLIVFFALYWAMALTMNLNIGHRHILPTYPVVYVLGSASALWLATHRSRLIAFGLVTGFLLHAGESFLSRPFYLSYFQSFAGGPAKGYRYLADSSYDWGQGLPDLKHWLDSKETRSDPCPVFLSYFGADSPSYRELKVIRFGDEMSESEPRVYPARFTQGWYIVGATQFTRVYAPTRGPWTARHEDVYKELKTRLSRPSARNPQTQLERKQVLDDCMDLELMQSARLFHYLQNREPLEIIGGSLLVFYLNNSDLAVALQSPLPPD